MKLQHARPAIGVIARLTAAALATVAAMPARSSTPISGPAAVESAPVRGPKSSLTILPVRVTDAAMPRVSEVLGLMLERRGLVRLELGPVPFDPPPGIAFGAWSEHLRGFLRQHSVTTDYVLYAEFNGTRGTGLTELRAILVTAAGVEVWTDRKAAPPGSPNAWSAREPMTMAALLTEDLAPQFGLNPETARMAPPGKMARLMEERSGLPPAAERDALPNRQQRFSSNHAKATILVYPVRVRGMADTECAAHIARLLIQVTIGKACSVARPVLLTASRTDPNELKALWDLAREFRDHVRQNPPEADYVLFADYAFNGSRWEQGFVHLVLCDASGDWVIVDLQNSHQSDYQKLRPTTKADCDKLVVRRLQYYVRRALNLGVDDSAGD